MFQEICRWLVTPQAPHAPLELSPADISGLDADEKRCYQKVVNDVMNNFSKRKDTAFTSHVYNRDTYGIIFRHTTPWKPEITILQAIAGQSGSTNSILVSKLYANTLLNKIKLIITLQEQLLKVKAELNQISNTPHNHTYKEKEHQILRLKDETGDHLSQIKSTIDLGLNPTSSVSVHVQNTPPLHSLLHRLNKNWTQYILFFDNDVSLLDEELCVGIINTDPARKHMSTAKKVDSLKSELSKPTVKAIFLVQEVIENNTFLYSQIQSCFAIEMNQKSSPPLKSQRSSSSHVVTAEFYIDDYYHVEDAPSEDTFEEYSETDEKIQKIVNLALRQINFNLSKIVPYQASTTPGEIAKANFSIWSQIFG